MLNLPRFVCETSKRWHRECYGKRMYTELTGGGEGVCFSMPQTQHVHDSIRPCAAQNSSRYLIVAVSDSGFWTTKTMRTTRRVPTGMTVLSKVPSMAFLAPEGPCALLFTTAEWQQSTIIRIGIKSILDASPGAGSVMFRPHSLLN